MTNFDSLIGTSAQPTAPAASPEKIEILIDVDTSERMRAFLMAKAAIDTATHAAEAARLAIEFHIETEKAARIAGKAEIWPLEPLLALKRNLEKTPRLQ